MQVIPADIWERYLAVLNKRAVPVLRHSDYRKWLRYYLDFRSKYPLPDSKSEHVRLFIQKLREKKQTTEQQKQAAHALSLYFEMLRKTDKKTTHTHNPRTPFIKGEYSEPISTQQDVGGSVAGAPVPPPSAGKRFNEWRCMAKSESPAWDKIIDTLAAEIKMRHYSRKTLKTYADWSRKFQRFLHNKLPDELSAADVKSYISHLAVNCNVAASTQNQAFNALLFLYRHILKHLKYPYDIAVKLLYGCGLRLFECVKLQVKNFNFDAGILTLHGKGSKDRTVPIPQAIMPELTAHFEIIKKLHEADIAAGEAYETSHIPHLSSLLRNSSFAGQL